ncbi:MAG: Ig-like domain-containing protein [Rhodanobacteraceae bacterium]|nr:Ig-like domain-containing protein [Rhodanobacteraceae bacterium]
MSFNVDAAPSVLTTTPANGATNVPPTSAISIDFSESVSFSTLAQPAPGNPSFDLICDGLPAGFTVTSVSPNDPVVLNPSDIEVAGRSCVLTVVAAQIADNDAIDPPNNMAANFTATIGFGAIANDDAYTVTPHLTLNIPTTGVQGGGTAANDILGAGAVTGFGFAPACTGTTAGAQLDAGAANGRLTLNANGSFAYEPPAGLNALTRTFCYTVTGGDTADIVFTVQNQARVWFVDAAAAASGVGTQARPFNALTGAGSFNAVAADGDGDTIYLEGAQTGGLTLRSGQRVIGGGSTLNIATFSGVAPVAGSAFPALSGSAPVITCSGVTCLTLNSSGAANTHSLRGFTIGDSGAAGTDLAGTNFGTLAVSELRLNGNGRALNLENGSFGPGSGMLGISTTASNNEGVRLEATGGPLLLGGPVSISGTTGIGWSMNNIAASTTLAVTGFNVTKTSAGAAVSITNATGLPTISLSNVTLSASNGSALVCSRGHIRRQHAHRHRRQRDRCGQRGLRRRYDLQFGHLHQHRGRRRHQPRQCHRLAGDERRVDHPERRQRDCL